MTGRVCSHPGPGRPRSRAGLRRSARLFLVAGLAAAPLVSESVPALAHGVLISASPTPNIGLGRPPEAVKLRFSEPLRLPPSTIRVFDAQGRDLVRSLRRVPTDPQSMEGKLPPLERGTYRVEWRSVSTVDGHTIRGSYLFGVGDPPPGAPPASESGPLTGPGIPGIAARVTQDAALFLLTGLALATLLSRGTVPLMPVQAVRLLRPVATLALAATLATVLADAVAAAGWSPDGMRAYLTGSLPGWARAALPLLVLAALAAAVRRSPVVVLGFTMTALGGIGMSGHAGATSLPAASMAANAGHVALAGVWVGTAAAIALLWSRIRPDRAEIQALMRRAAPLAAASGVLVAGGGIASATWQLELLSDLWTTSYGGLVAAKGAALLAIAGLGVRHSLVLRSRLAAAPANPAASQVSRGMLRALAGERWVGAGAVVLAAVLVAFPDPPAQEARAERQASTVPAIFAAGEGPFVTLASEDGPVLISLTVAPPRPGEVTLAVQLISTDISTEGWRVQVRSEGPGGMAAMTRLEPCGPGCFVGRARAAELGVWSFTVDAQGRRAAFRIPLPTPDGTAVLRRLRDAWDRLESLRIDEEFRSGTGFALDTTYLYEAPDRAAVRTSAGREEIDIADRSFTRSEPGVPWKERRNPFPTKVPFPFLWVRATEEPLLLLDTVVGGRPAYTLALFDPFGIWYRIAVDKEIGRPLEDRMRTIAHFMDRRYSRFNEPLGIRAPE